MGTITILPETTKNPITLMGQRAGVCWGGNVEDPEKNYKRGMDCIISGHGRVMEYVNVEMIIAGYSARVEREWYTHIGGSPTRLQSSTRYINYAGRGFDYIIPPSIQNNKEALEKYQALMAHINEECRALQEDYGIPKEDVANGLPLGMTASIVDKRNLRSLTEMSHQRMCNRAYWEYRQLFGDIRKALSEYSEEWRWIADNLFMPKCDYFGYCSETRPWGNRCPAFLRCQDHNRIMLQEMQQKRLKQRGESVCLKLHCSVRRQLTRLQPGKLWNAPLPW